MTTVRPARLIRAFAAAAFFLTSPTHAQGGAADQLKEATKLLQDGIAASNKLDFAAALPLFERSLRLHVEAVGEKDRRVLDGLRRVSYALYRLQRYKEALALDERRLKLSLEVLGERHADTIFSLRDVAIGYQNFYADGYARSLPLLEKTVTLQLEVLGEKHQATILIMNDLANAYAFVGRYSESLAVHERKLGIATRVYGADHDWTLGALQAVAIAYSSIGRGAEALPIYEKLLQRALAKHGERNRGSAFDMERLAAAYLQAERAPEALALMEKVMSLRQDRTLFMEKDRETIHFLTTKAEIHARMGRPDEAAALHEQAYSLQVEDAGERGERSFTALSSLNNLAQVYSLQGKFEEARARHERALQLRTEVQGPQHPDTLQSLSNLAIVYQQLGRDGDARALYERLVPAVETLRASGDLSSENRQALFAQWVWAYKSYARLLVAGGSSADAFRLAELSKARTLLESTAMRRANQSDLLNSTERDRVQAYERRIAELNDRIAAAAGRQDQRFALEADKNAAVAEYAEFRRQLAAKYPKYAQLNDVQILGAEAGGAVLGAGTLLLNYLVDGHRTIVFTLSAKGLTARDLGEIGQLTQIVETYRRLISQVDSVRGLAREGGSLWKLPDGSYAMGTRSPGTGAVRVTNAAELGRYLADKLLAPVRAELSGHKHLVISPDGALATLPFEALLLGDQALISSFDVSYTQSLSMLGLLKVREESYRNLEGRRDLFAMGGAIYQPATGRPVMRGALPAPGEVTPGSDARLALSRGASDPQSVQRIFDTLKIQWTNLPGSEKEVDSVARIFSDGQYSVHKQRDATEANLASLNAKGELRRYRYLLFSAHGYLSTEEPALSSLVLGQVDKARGTDGYVTASEWPGYDLASDLVVLSACDTGMGKVVQGEGVMGLPYALYVAGNKNTLLSLWPVEDESTSLFMTSFFKRLKGGSSQVSALNQTKREFISDSRFAQPVFWAPFVLYGY